MAETLGHAPLLLALLLNNNNNNPANQPPNAATLVGLNNVAELSSLGKLERSLNEQTSSDDILRLRGAALDFNPISQIQIDSFHKNGFLVLPDLLSTLGADTLLRSAQSVVDRVYVNGHDIIHHNILPDGSNAPHPKGRILATFETGTFNNPLSKPQIARLGCGIHTHLLPFASLTSHPFHRSVARVLLDNKDPLITQSQLILKASHLGGAIAPHQDGCVSFTDPASALTFWYALEDSGAGNGGLEVARGSHLVEPVRERMVRLGKGGGSGFKELLGRGDEAVRGDRGGRNRAYKYEPLEVSKGGLVIFHGNLMHKSGRNVSGKGRMAYSFTVIDGSCECPDDTYMKPLGGEFDRL